MPKKIRFETDENTSDEESGEEGGEEIIDGMSFPQPMTTKDKIRHIQDLMEEAGNAPVSVFKGRRIIENIRKGIGKIGVNILPKKSIVKKVIPKGKKLF